MTHTRTRFPAFLFAVALGVAAAGLSCTEASAQTAPAPPANRSRVAEPAPPPAIPRAEDRNAQETRERLNEVLRQYPPSVGQVLRLDPSLLTAPNYVATYPNLAAFLAQHPEVAHNPAFFLGGPRGGGWEPVDARREAIHMWGNVFQGLTIFLVICTITFALAWLIRTLIDYRRWHRLSKVQTDVHTKLLDRFNSNEDLLAYIQTSPGRRFLESAPIPMDLGPRAISAPFGRILWSLQAGLVLALGGLGLYFVSLRVALEDVSQPLFVMGVVAVALGIGFVLSAAAAYVLSQRLGLLERPAEPASQTRGSGIP